MNNEQAELVNRELALEDEMLDMGSKRFWEAINKAQHPVTKSGKALPGTESDTIYGLTLAKLILTPLAEALEAFVEETKHKKAPKPVILRCLTGADYTVTAFISVKVVLDCITVGNTVAATATNIGSALEDEMRFRHFKDTNKALWAVVNRDLDSRTKNTKHKRKVLIHSMDKAAQTDEAMGWKVWTEHERFHTGMPILKLLAAESIALIKITTRKESRNRTVSYVEMTDKTMEYIDTKLSRCALLAPVYMPMLATPRDWVGVYGGGYLSEKVKALPIVKTRRKNYLEELANKSSSMPSLFASMNAIQRTPWRINKRVLSVMQRIWDAGQGQAAIPSREDLPLPAKPDDIATNKEALKEWKWKTGKVHEKRVKQKSKRVQFQKTLFVAEKFQDESAIYFPHQLDFRGRLYAVPSFLNPQSNDPAKALLEFAEGKPVGKDGLRWLKIHAANSYGIDKCSLEERVKWTDEHLTEIEACARDPFACDFWAATDEHPWQFLAACFELAEAIHDETHVSHLPVSVDGTCNGLQNFSAMLRDEVGGAAVNLVPSELPRDIYQTVANVAMAKIEAAAAAGEMTLVSRKKEPERYLPLAQQWIEYGFNRKAAKRPVMVLPYGGTLYSSREYVEEYLVERISKGDTSQWGEKDVFAAAAYLAGHIWNSIGEVVIAARAAMGWLQQVATVAAKDGLPVNWVTPVGFPVLQAYPELSSRRVDTMLGSTLLRYSLSFESEDELDRRKQASAISPNFVHSMDACALMLCVRRCLDHGISNFGMVHDSYGTLAADMDQMAVCLREAFIELYQHDVLEEFRVSVIAGLTEANAKLIPPVPPKGNLDLNGVMQSTYFFA